MIEVINNFHLKESLFLVGEDRRYICSPKWSTAELGGFDPKFLKALEKGDISANISESSTAF
jgi:hypothetical protein